MSNYVNIWMAVSAQATNEYKSKDELGDAYGGPMDDTTFSILSKLADKSTLDKFYTTPTIGGKIYSIFSLYIEGTAKLATAIDYITTEWPTHIVILGAWWMDGRLVGTDWVLDVNGNPTGEITGTPTYPVHDQTWRIIPGASSNADLKDLLIIQGQTLRRWL